MWSRTARAAAFWLACIPARVALAWLAFTRAPAALAVVYGWLGLSNTFLWLGDARMHAPEGGGTTWWATARPLFALIYFASAAVVVSQPTGSRALVPFLDPAAGAVLWFTSMRP